MQKNRQNNQPQNKQIVSPTDVQFKLDDQDKEEVMHIIR